VAEAVLFVGAPVGRLVLQEPLRDEGLEVAAERAAGLWRQQFPDRLYREVLTSDGRAPSRASIVGGSTGQISLPGCSLSEAANCSR